jgi:hypothetical protein
MKAIISNTRFDQAPAQRRPHELRNLPPKHAEISNSLKHFGQTNLSMYTVMRYSIPRRACANFPDWPNALLEVLWNQRLPAPRRN